MVTVKLNKNHIAKQLYNDYQAVMLIVKECLQWSEIWKHAKCCLQFAYPYSVIEAVSFLLSMASSKNFGNL